MACSKILILAAILVPLSVLLIQKRPKFVATCSAGCEALAGSCYAASGAVFGTVTAGVGTPPAILSCNSALGICMSAFSSYLEEDTTATINCTFNDCILNNYYKT